MSSTSVILFGERLDIISSALHHRLPFRRLPASPPRPLRPRFPRMWSPSSRWSCNCWGKSITRPGRTSICSVSWAGSGVSSTKGFLLRRSRIPSRPAWRVSSGRTIAPSTSQRPGPTGDVAGNTEPGTTPTVSTVENASARTDHARSVLFVVCLLSSMHSFQSNGSIIPLLQQPNRCPSPDGYPTSDPFGLFSGSARKTEIASACKSRIYRTRPEGFEPPTDGLEIRCSILLSYGRSFFVQTKLLAIRDYLLEQTRPPEAAVECLPTATVTPSALSGRKPWPNLGHEPVQADLSLVYIQRADTARVLGGKLSTFQV